MIRTTLIAAALTLATANLAAAQAPEPDLAAIARQAEAAKGSAPKAKKSYTNADLSSAGLPPSTETAPAAAGYMSSSRGKPVTAEEMVTRSEEKAAADLRGKLPDEYWVGQATAIRKQVDKMVPRLAELDARKPNPNAALQKRSEQEKAMLQEQIASLRKKWDGLQAEARAAKANLGLLSPPPAFPE
ncbi:MAG: hypothetical protein RLZZ53_2720 [Acidobacteriota bacterium]|jgi:hypothetical protein